MVEEDKAIDDALDTDQPLFAVGRIGEAFLIFSPPIAPSTTTWPTWIPSLAYSFAIACANVRSPAFDELNAP